MITTSIAALMPSTWTPTSPMVLPSATSHVIVWRKPLGSVNGTRQDLIEQARPRQRDDGHGARECTGELSLVAKRPTDRQHDEACEREQDWEECSSQHDSAAKRRGGVRIDALVCAVHQDNDGEADDDLRHGQCDGEEGESLAL